MRIISVLVSIVTLFFLCVGAAPAQSAALAGLSIGDIINALNIGLVERLHAIITLDTFVTNIISVDFDAKNPLPIELTIDRVVSSAGLNGTVFATFDRTFEKPVVVPIFGTKNSGVFGNVLLTKGVEASLDIIPFGVLDLITADVYIRAGTIFGKLGIPITLDGLQQSNIPTTYDLVLS
ncbi:hypothetical protein Hypma_013423 [Hypsizygus marmoreus]|uniref:Late embryogenesis abundant protein LEA-2 subgroup domain-containing protein n=1 Tax=Hypsizygus marmoreus TaxID=39966 RepID=A0A369JFI8_HYPMA|nr:hypothetical protein Hypma_013423 [Hypsizygus marmoreus]